MNKKNIIVMVELLQQRTGIEYTKIVLDMKKIMKVNDPNASMTREKFDARFRRFPERDTKYTSLEIYALLRAFTPNASQPPCSVYEAALLYLWSQADIVHYKNIAQLFDETQFEKVIKFCSQYAKDFIQLDWSLEEVRQTTGKKFEQARDPLERLQTIPFDSFKTDNLQASSQRKSHTASDKAPIIQEVMLLRKQGKFSQAQKLLCAQLKTRDIANTLRVEIQHQLGIVYIQLNQFESALEHLKSALQLAKEHHVEEIAAILANLGHCEMTRANDNAAHAYFMQSLDAARNTNNTTVTRFVKSAIAILLTQQNKFEEAEDYYQFALDAALEQQNSRDMLVNYLHLGLLSFLQGKTEIAIRHYEQALDLIEEINDMQFRIQLGWYYSMLHLYEIAKTVSEQARAEYNLLEAQRAATLHNYSWHEAAIGLDLAIYYMFTNQRQAHYQYDKIIENGIKSDLAPDLVACAIYGKAALILEENIRDDKASINGCEHIIRESLTRENIRELRETVKKEHIVKATYYFQRGLVYRAVNQYPIEQSLRRLFNSLSESS